MSEARISGRQIVAAMIVATAGLLPGCALFAEDLKPPTVALDSLQITRANLDEQRYLVRLKVMNPNPVAVPVAGVTYALQLEGQTFAQGETRASFTLPADGEALVELVVNTSLVDSLQRLGALVRQGSRTLHYQLRGGLQLGSVLLPAVPFERKGEIRLTR